MTYPEYYDCYIGTGQMIDFDENEIAFREEAAKWAKNDVEGMALVDKLTSEEYSMEYYAARNGLMERYDYDMFTDGTDYNILAAQIFNPYYTISAG